MANEINATQDDQLTDIWNVLREFIAQVALVQQAADTVAQALAWAQGAKLAAQEAAEVAVKQIYEAAEGFTDIDGECLAAPERRAQ